MCVPHLSCKVQLGFKSSSSLITGLELLPLHHTATQWPVSKSRVSSVQVSSVVQSRPLCDPTDCSTPGSPVHHQLPEPTQTHAHRISDAIQPAHPLPSPSPPAFNPSQHQGLFHGVSSSHQVVKVLEFQLQHQSFQ